MIIIRKIVFITFSISAFIYLVLQTSHGQLWLSQTQQTLFGEPTKDIRVASLKDPNDSFTQLLKNSEHAKQILKLETQLYDMQTAIDEVMIAMQELTALNEKLHRENQLLGNVQTQNSQENSGSAQLISPPTTFQQARTSASVFDNQQNMAVQQTVKSSKPSKADVRLRQLEHQARLEEVVQRMELTALQAISR
nr:hypothetical protein [uncultured Glaciecola sp.]